MSEFDRQNIFESVDEKASLRSYITKVFTHMAIGLAITSVIAYLCYRSIVSYGLMAQLFFLGSSAGVMQIGLVIAQIAAVLILNFMIGRLSPMITTVLFYAYAALTGVSFGILPLSYGLGIVFEAFMFAAVLFISCAIIGHTTNIDLTKYTGVLFGALIALVVMSVISLFVPALRENIMIGYLGLFIFMVYTAFDIQRIKQYFYMTTGQEQARENLAIYGALQLYLDFINMFLYLLRILSKRRR